METNTCNNCGQQNKASARFCTSCGKALSRPAANPWSAPVSQPPGTVMMESTAWDMQALPAVTPPVPAPLPPSFEDSRSPNPAPPLAPALTNRPGCVTLYAVLLIIGGVATAAVGVWLDDALILAIGSVLGVANVIIAVGLFRQRNWARVSVIVLMVMSILAQLYSALVGLSSGATELVVRDVAGIVVPIFIASWFARNKQHFH